MGAAAFGATGPLAAAPSEEEVRVSVSGATEVLVALYHRDDASDQGKGQKDWEATFKALGARVPVFLPWAATTADKLAEQLKGSAR